MSAYIVRRILLMIPTMVLVAMSTFSLLRLVPGDTLTAQILSAGQPGVQYDHQRVADLKKQLGLDGSIPEQFVRWVGGMAKGDFQDSFITNKGTLGQFGAFNAFSNQQGHQRPATAPYPSSGYQPPSPQVPSHAAVPAPVGAGARIVGDGPHGARGFTADVVKTGVSQPGA